MPDSSLLTWHNFRPFTVPQIQRADCLLRSLQALSHAEQQLGGAHYAMVHQHQPPICCSAVLEDTEDCLDCKEDLSFGGEIAKQSGSARGTEDLRAAGFRYCTALRHSAILCTSALVQHVGWQHSCTVTCVLLI